MPRKTNPIPDGFHAVTPQLVARDARALIAFCEKALGAELRHQMPGPDGNSVMHAMLAIGDSNVFVSDAVGFSKPTTTNLYLYVKDVDAAFARATSAGAKVISPLMNMFWGDRWGMVEDPFGNHWQLASHVEDVSPEEMQRRMAAQSPPS
jgi:uncharacterized glyoxalase superfamily protein PhnB